MGDYYNWECKTCGERSEYRSGSGFASAGLGRESALAGDFGKLAQELAQQEREELLFIKSYVLYYCAECNSLVQGNELIIRSRDDFHYLFVASEDIDECPICKDSFGMKKLPCQDNSKMFRKTVPPKCPSCGANNIEAGCGCWD